MAKEVEKRSGKATRQRYKKDRRETVIQVRMNAEELALLDGKRGGRTRSNYLRGALYGSAGSHTEHEVVADTPQLDRMLMELNRIGVNINQIARAFNARVKGMGMLEEIKMEPDKKAFESLRESIEGLSDEVKELRADLHDGITGDDVCAGIARRAGTHVLHRVRRGKAQTRPLAKRDGPHRRPDGRHALPR